MASRLKPVLARQAIVIANTSRGPRDALRRCLEFSVTNPGDVEEMLQLIRRVELITGWQIKRLTLGPAVSGDRRSIGTDRQDDA